MKAVIDWLLGQRYRLILLAIALAPFVALVSTALLALDTVRRGVSQGMMSAGIAVGGMLVLAVITGSNAAVLGAVGIFSFLSGVLIGALLLRSAQSFAVTFEWLAMIAGVVIVLFVLAGDGGRGVFGPVLDQVLDALRDGGATAEQIEALTGWQHLLTGVIIALLFVQLAIALVLSHWWSAMAEGVERFGAQFREFRLSRAVGLAAVGIIGLALVLDIALVRNLAPLAIVALLFQGLAVLHAWAYRRQWHPIAVAPVYVLLVTPLSGIIMLAMVAVGMLDNLFDLRAPLRSGA
jgi:hypothetical protein